MLLPLCALCGLNERYAAELGFLAWTCPECAHVFLANNSRGIDGPWGGPPGQEAGVCTSCAYRDGWHTHDPLDMAPVDRPGCVL